jgi:hypothetical protein
LLLDGYDGAADVVLAESVSMAMLVLLGSLSPDERAVFVPTSTPSAIRTSWPRSRSRARSAV